MIWMDTPPAIIKPSPPGLHIANFLPGWFPGLVTQLPSRVYIGTTSDASDAQTYTFTNHAIGTAHPSRLVVVGVHWANALAQNRPLDTLTIGGNDATVHRQDVSAVNLSIRSAVTSLSVPTGTTATIEVNLTGGSVLKCAISVWAVYGLASTTPVDSNGGNVQSGSSASTTLDINAGGLAIAAMTSSADEDHTVAGLLEDADVSFDGDRAIPASNHRMAAATGLTISQSSATGTAGRALSAVSWR